MEVLKPPAACVRLAATGPKNTRFRQIPVSCFHQESGECRAAECAGGGVPGAEGDFIGETRAYGVRAWPGEVCTNAEPPFLMG